MNSPPQIGQIDCLLLSSQPGNSVFQHSVNQPETRTSKPIRSAGPVSLKAVF
ncbi:hypothetical protein LguiB_026471 [Lonicera macranthoides]